MTRCISSPARSARCIRSRSAPDNEALDRPPFLEPDSLECPHQLPLARLLRVLERARTLPNVDKGVLDQAERLARINAASLNGPAPENLVHGDLHFENVLYEKGEITALLDFEFARAGPPDLDLEIILRFCADPQLHVSVDYAPTVNRDDYRSVLRWIHEAYPELFENPALESRLNLYSLSYDLARPRRRSAPQAVRPAAAVPCVPTAASSSRRARHAPADRVVSQLRLLK